VCYTTDPDISRKAPTSGASVTYGLVDVLSQNSTPRAAFHCYQDRAIYSKHGGKHRYSLAHQLQRDQQIRNKREGAEMAPVSHNHPWASAEANPADRTPGDHLAFSRVLLLPNFYPTTVEDHMNPHATLAPRFYVPYLVPRSRHDIIRGIFDLLDSIGPRARQQNHYTVYFFSFNRLHSTSTQVPFITKRSYASAVKSGT
jgi:hypothetical protein